MDMEKDNDQFDPVVSLIDVVSKEDGRVAIKELHKGIRGIIEGFCKKDPDMFTYGCLRFSMYMVLNASLNEIVPSKLEFRILSSMIHMHPIMIGCDQPSEIDLCNSMRDELIKIRDVIDSVRASETSYGNQIGKALIKQAGDDKYKLRIGIMMLLIICDNSDANILDDDMLDSLNTPGDEYDIREIVDSNRSEFMRAKAVMNSITDVDVTDLIKAYAR